MTINTTHPKKNFISFRTIFIVLLIIITLILVGTLINEESNTAPNTDSLAESEQRYVAVNTRTLTYDPAGILTYELQANEVENFPESGVSFIKAPQLVVFNREALAEWKITSSTATIDENRNLTLIDNVLVKGLLDNSILESISTSKATINLNTQDISSNEKVNIIGQGFKSEGIGMMGNINNQTAKLLKDVTSIYYPKILKEANK